MSPLVPEENLEKLGILLVLIYGEPLKYSKDVLETYQWIHYITELVTGCMRIVGTGLVYKVQNQSDLAN